MRLLALTPNPAIDKTVLLDRLEPGQVHRSGEVEAVPGGKGNNVARIAKALGARVRVGGVLAGHAGRWMEQAYKAEGFGDGVFAWAPTGETRTCVIMVDRPDGRTGRATVLNEEGPRVGDAVADQLVAAVLDTLEYMDWVSLSGSLPPGSDPKVWAGLVRRVREAGVPVAVDCSGPWLKAAVAAGPSLIRINGEEAAGLLGEPVVTMRDALRAAETLQTGTGGVVVSLGADGAAAATDRGRWVVQVPAVEVVSPIGGGDVMMAGILCSLMGGADFPEAVRRGAALATAKCLIAGSSRFRPDDYERLLPQTHVREA
jgi:1-phosphofructokinase family hexose kinase